MLLFEFMSVSVRRVARILSWEGFCPKDYLSGAPPSVGAERTGNFEKLRPLRRPEMAFFRLVRGIRSRNFELSLHIFPRHSFFAIIFFKLRSWGGSTPRGYATDIE